MIYVLWAISLGFGIARFIVPFEGAINPADVYKDMAHLFVGFLFGYAVARTQTKHNDYTPIDEALSYDGQTLMVWTLAAGLTILEVVAFVARSK